MGPENPKGLSKTGPTQNFAAVILIWQELMFSSKNAREGEGEGDASQMYQVSSLVQNKKSKNHKRGNH
jgi:hypothetical protein